MKVLLCTSFAALLFATACIASPVPQQVAGDEVFRTLNISGLGSQAVNFSSSLMLLPFQAFALAQQQATQGLNFAAQATTSTIDNFNKFVIYLLTGQLSRDAAPVVPATVPFAGPVPLVWNRFLPVPTQNQLLGVYY